MEKEILLQLLVFVLIHGQDRVVVNDGLGTVIGGAFGGKSGSLVIDMHETTMINVNIRCRNDQNQGLVCSADYPDRCKEQWNFPNPCTQYNIDMNVTKFVHPYDKTRFLMCGQLGKLYIVQCPQYEEFSERCGQCVGQDAGLIGSCSELPLPPIHNNPCTREAILQNKLFFPFHGNLSMFIHCDIWGKPWERICTPGEVWSVWDVTCVLPHLLNPCNRPTTDINYSYGHPCDPAKYLTCDIHGRAHEINCARGEAFDETNQRCRPYRDFKDRILSSYCEHYVFGFRQYQGNDGTVIEGGGIGFSGGAISGVTGQGFQRDNTGLNIDRTIRKVDGTVTVTRDSSGQGLNANLDLRGGSLHRETNLQGQGGGTAAFDRTTQVRGGSLSRQINTDGQGQFDGRLDLKRGSLSGGRSGAIGQGSLEQGFNGGATRNFIDVRDKSLSSGVGTAEFFEINSAGTSGRSANRIDIRGQKGSGTGGMDMVDVRTGKRVDIRGGTFANGMDVSGAGTGLSGNMRDIRHQGTGGMDMVDVRTGKRVDIRGTTIANGMDVSGARTGLSGNMRDIRHQGTGGMDMVDVRTGKRVDIRGTTIANGMDVSGAGTGLSSGNMRDIRHQGTGGMDMVDVRTGKRVDIRGTTIANGMDVSGAGTGLSGNMRDIRHQGTGGMDMVDVRTGKRVDIRGTTIANGMDVSGAGTGLSSGNMRDIRHEGTGGMDMVDVRTGKRVDIRGTTIANGMDVSGAGTGLSGNMRDIRHQGTGGMDMVDVRTGKRVDIRGTTIANGMDVSGAGTGLSSGNMRDIRHQGTGGMDMVDVRTGKRVDIRGGTFSNGMDVSGSGAAVSGNMRDIRHQGTGGMDMVDVRTGKRVDIRGGTFANGLDVSGAGTGLSSGNMRDIRHQGTSGMDTVDLRTGKRVDIRGGTFANDMDVSGAGTGVSGNMRDIRHQGTSGMDTVDVRTGKRVDIRGVSMTNGMAVSGSGTGSGSNSNPRVNIRTGQTAGTEIEVEVAGSGPVSVNAGAVDSSGQLSSGFAKIPVTRTETGTSPGDRVDISNIGSRSGRTVDIGGAKTSLSSNFIDTRTGAGNTGFVDISGSTVDMSVQGSGTSSSNIMDLRGRKASGTNSKVDILGASSGGRSIDISGSKTEIAGGMVDIAGGTNNGMAGIRGGSGSMTTIDVRGARQGTLDGTGGIVDPLTGQDQASWIDVIGQDLTRTSSGQLTDIVRNQQNQGSLTTGNQNGFGSSSSFDLRNQLGLNGQTGTANVDSTGRINTNSIGIRGSVQDGRQGGRSMNEILNTWNQIIEAGSTVTGQGTLTQTGIGQTGQIMDTSRTIHPSRLRLYEMSSGHFVPPCTRKNIDEGRTHFRHKGFPHEFIQCDQSGTMHRMECGIAGWFDVYTNTCVDGPVHVDNQVQ